jgi:ribosomal protein L21E
VKKGEMVHIECAASLMKEVAIRQYQGGYSGFSIPLGKTGIRYKVGGSRGHSVEVGTQLNVADSGVLSVTNKRVVYSGTRKTVDMPYSKLVNLGVYNDGLQFHLSNRVNAPLFQVPRGSQVVAAIVNAAAQRAE